jgi:serine/threonine protein kinase
MSKPVRTKIPTTPTTGLAAKRCPECETEYKKEEIVCTKDNYILRFFKDDVVTSTLEQVRSTFGERFTFDGWYIECSDSLLLGARQDEELLAIKILNVDTNNPAREKRKERFIRGSHEHEQLSHKNIVKFYEAGAAKVSPFSPYIILEYVPDGLSLAQVKLSDLPVRYTVDIIAQVCDGMAHAQEKGVFHSDLSPNDFLFAEAPDGGIWVKITDFAKGAPLIHSDNRLEQHTGRGDIFGHPEFMSPEACRGQPIDARSNIYSLGCIMYHCLAESQPFDGPHWGAIMLKKLMDTVPPLPPLKTEPDLTDALSSIIAKCMEIEPQKRYQSASELKQALTEVTCDRSELSTYNALCIG